jgi:hypothetical protein
MMGAMHFGISLDELSRARRVENGLGLVIDVNKVYPAPAEAQKDGFTRVYHLDGRVVGSDSALTSNYFTALRFHPDGTPHPLTANFKKVGQDRENPFRL